jgi:regulator of protease activity HflC (stomatin/prohibitin superfamily)
MNSEIRGRVQMTSANFSAQYKLDDLRNKKNEMAKKVQEDVIEFFKTRGITITMVGMFGGMTYENPKIQDAIDQTFVSQQEKVNASAFLDAQKDKNARINSEATALAEASRSKAKGEADGIEFINVALAKANNNPQLIELRQIEVEKARIDKWNGTYPSTVAGAGAQTWVGLSQKDEVAPVMPKK